MSAHLVSIGLPVYNCREYIAETLASLLSQSYAPVELIISDNASADGTTEILRAAACSDSRIRLTVQPRNLGMVENFETVRKMALGEYFFWAGADDLWHERYVEVLVRELEANPKATLAMTATQRVDTKGEPIDQIRYTGPHDPNSLSPLAQAKRLIAATSELKNLKYNMFFCGLFQLAFLNSVLDRRPDLHFGGDRPLPCIAALSGGLRYVDEPYMLKRVHPTPFGKRNSNDAYNKSATRAQFWYYFCSLIVWIWDAPTIPRRIKLVAPVVILAPMIAHRYRIRIIDTLPEGVRFALRRIYLHLVPKKGSV